MGMQTENDSRHKDGRMDARAAICAHAGRNGGHEDMSQPSSMDEGVFQISQTDKSVPRSPSKDKGMPRQLLMNEANLTIADERRT